MQQQTHRSGIPAALAVLGLAAGFSALAWLFAGGPPGHVVFWALGVASAAAAAAGFLLSSTHGFAAVRWVSAVGFGFSVAVLAFAVILLTRT